VFTLKDIFDQSLWPPRMAASLLLTFAALSLVLAMIGIYGVMAYAVTQRTREIGIRMALGASGGEVLRTVIAHGLRLTAIGVAAGLALSFAGARLAASALGTLLINVNPTDVATFVVVPVVLSLVALGACYFPARRATRIDPVVALRYE